MSLISESTREFMPTGMQGCAGLARFIEADLICLPNGTVRRELGTQCPLQREEKPGRTACIASSPASSCAEVTGSQMEEGWFSFSEWKQVLVLTSAKSLFLFLKLFVNIWLLFCDMRGCSSETHLTLKKLSSEKEKILHYLKKKYIYIYFQIWGCRGSCLPKQNAPPSSFLF